MKSAILLLAMIGCAVATAPVVTTLYSGLDRNTIHIQNGPPIGGSISASLPSIGGVAPILSQLAPLASSLGNLGSIGDLASIGNLGSLVDLVSLGARFLPPAPSVQVRSSPISISVPFPIPSFTPVTYSAGALGPYPYSLYAGARFF